MGPRTKSLLKRLIRAGCAGFGTVTHVATREPLVALTFDDGPHPESTPRLLEVLERHGARATFFMIGREAARHPELVRRVAEAGHAVGNHSWDHTSFPLLRAGWRRTQLRWCEAALRPYGERLFRPPYGHQSLGSHLDAVRLGYRPVTWSVSADDWLDDPAPVLAARVRQRLEPGSIVLLHDALYTTVEERYRDRGPTIGAVETLLAELDGRFRFVTVPELLRAGRAQKWPWYRRPDLDWLHRLA